MTSAGSFSACAASAGVAQMSCNQVTVHLIQTTTCNPCQLISTKCSKLLWAKVGARLMEKIAKACGQDEFNYYKELIA